MRNGSTATGEARATLHMLQTELLDAVQEAVIATDADRRIIYWNPFAEQLYGWKAAEVLGRDIIQVTPAERGAGDEALGHVERGDTWSGEFLVRRKSGETFPAFVTVSPIKGANGQSIGAMGVSFDLSTQKQRDLGYDALFAAMSEGFALCEVIRDQSGKLVDYTIREINPALQSMLGVGPEVVGTKLSDPGPPTARWLAVCNGVLQSGEPANFDYQNRATGRWHEIRIHRVGANRLAQFFFDITDRKTAEAELLASRSYLRLILDSAADGFYCVNREGVTTHCNTAFLRMLGFKSEREVIGRSLHATIHHSHPDGSPYDKSQCPIYQSAQTGEAKHVDDERFFRLDGSSFPVEYWVQPILEAGALQGAICTFHDVTARKAAEEVQDLLLREMNHRVKNLFAVVNGVVSLSSRAVAGPKEMAETIRGRLDAIARAHDLILPTALRDEQTRPRRTDLATLATTVLSPYAERGDPNSRDRLTIEGPHVGIGDRAANALALVLHELTTNAGKYGALSNNTGRVRVGWLIVSDHVELRWVEQGGPAIAEPPAAEGFGSMLSRRSVEGQLQGALSHTWNREGLVVSINVSKERLAS